MFRGRLLVKSVVKRAVVTSSISGAFVLPAVTISQNVNNLPRVSIDFKTRSFVSSKVVNEVVVNDPPSGPSPNLVGRSSIFVGNLDFSVTEDQIMEMCYGMLGPKKALMARIAIDRDTGRSKGFAHVDFPSYAEADSAVRTLTGVELLGRPIRIDHAARKEDSMNRNAAPALSGQRPAIRKLLSSSEVHSIFLGNLSWDVTPELVEDMLNDVLGPGLFNQVRLAIDRETGRQRGFGHVDFINAETAARAVKELDGLEVMGRQLRVDHAQQREKYTGAGSRLNDKW